MEMNKCKICCWEKENPHRCGMCCKCHSKFKRVDKDYMKNATFEVKEVHNLINQ